MLFKKKENAREDDIRDWRLRAELHAVQPLGEVDIGDPGEGCLAPADLLLLHPPLPHRAGDVPLLNQISFNEFYFKYYIVKYIRKFEKF